MFLPKEKKGRLTNEIDASLKGQKLKGPKWEFGFAYFFTGKTGFGSLGLETTKKMGMRLGFEAKWDKFLYLSSIQLPLK